MGMGMCESWRVCHSCGREVGIAGGQSLGEAMCGWLIVSCIKDKDNFDRYSFCSAGCLHQWADGRLPAVPEIFRRSIDGLE
jgi:hypothetical protein